MNARRGYVNVRGESYRVAHVGMPGTGKFFGRCRLVLERESDHTVWACMARNGKPAHNARLVPANLPTLETT